MTAGDDRGDRGGPDSFDRQPTLGGHAGYRGYGPAQLRPGESIGGRYQLVELLDTGGVGQVWRAVDQRLGRSVAVKFLHPEVACHPEAVRRFLNEARAVAALNHPNIVQVHDFGGDDQAAYLVMELVDGRSLADRLRAFGPMDVGEAVSVICQVCDALAAAHARGVIHRDIKPGNILLTWDGVVKLSDFGLARQETAGEGQTRMGDLLGTPHFMAPEQWTDPSKADARSDLWSVAATLYQMVTGELPRVIVAERVPPAIRQVLLRALQTRPEDRYQTAADLRHALQAAVPPTAAGRAAAFDSGAAGPSPPATPVLLPSGFAGDPALELEQVLQEANSVVDKAEDQVAIPIFLAGIVAVIVTWIYVGFCVACGVGLGGFMVMGFALTFRGQRVLNTRYRGRIAALGAQAGLSPDQLKEKIKGKYPKVSQYW